MDSHLCDLLYYCTYTCQKGRLDSHHLGKSFLFSEESGIDSILFQGDPEDGMHSVWLTDTLQKQTLSVNEILGCSQNGEISELSRFSRIVLSTQG